MGRRKPRYAEHNPGPAWEGIGIVPEIEMLAHHLAEIEGMLDRLAPGQVDAGGDPMRHSIFMLHQAQQALRARERQFRALFEHALAAMLVVDDAVCCVDANPAACALFGLPRSKLLGQQLTDFEVSRQGHGSFWQTFLENQTLQCGEFALQRPDGSIRETEYAPTADFLPGHHLIVLQDVTERKQAERILHRSAQLQQDILNALPAHIALLDHRGSILTVNEAWKQFAVANGYRGQDFGVGRNYLEICESAWENGAPEAAAVLRGIHSVLENRMDTFSLEYPCHSPDCQRWFRLIVAPVEEKVRRKAVVMHLDITELTLLESQRTQTHKLEAVGALAAGIAHEINTPIQFVGDNVHFLSDAFASLQTVFRAYREVQQSLNTLRGSEPLLQRLVIAEREADWDYLSEEIPLAIAQTLEGIERVAAIVQAMRTFAHPASGEMMFVDLNEALRNSLIVARNEYKYVADVITEFDPRLPLVSCDLGDLNQVFLNLIVNAAHAIADKIGDDFPRGTITIRTFHTEAEAVVCVEDNGIGIPEAIHNRIFEPFFTTKAVGKGTGQGLAMAHATLTKKHKGRLRFESQVGKGTIFTIRLPLLPDSDGAGVIV